MDIGILIEFKKFKRNIFILRLKIFSILSFVIYKIKQFLIIFIKNNEEASKYTTKILSKLFYK